MRNEEEEERRCVRLRSSLSHDTHSYSYGFVRSLRYCSYQKQKQKNQLDVYSFPIKIGGICACLRARSPTFYHPPNQWCRISLRARRVYTHICGNSANDEQNNVRFHRIANGARVHDKHRMTYVCMHRSPLAHRHTHTHVRNQSLAINFSFECNVRDDRHKHLLKRNFKQRYAVCSRTSRAYTGQVAYFLADRPIKIPAVALLLLLVVLHWIRTSRQCRWTKSGWIGARSKFVVTYHFYGNNKISINNQNRLVGGSQAG